MWPHVRQLGQYQRWDIIPKEAIELTLAEMEEINAGFDRLAKDPRVDGRSQLQFEKGYLQFKKTIAGVRADLNNPAMYKLIDDKNYVKVPKP